MEEKKKFLSKFNMKDYKNEFEVILDEKDYGDEAKSLLLGIIYKLDNFYKDYMNVKIECDSKNVYLENFMKLIKEKCQKITIFKPQQSKKMEKFRVNKQLGIIESIPNEYILFYALNELKERYNENEKYLLDDYVSKCVNYTLSKGRSINDTEPIRDFNGWSWNPQIENSNNITYNLVYQNLSFILGYKFLEENIGKTNIIDILLNKTDEEGFGENGKNFINSLIETCVILFNNSSSKNHEMCLKYKNKLISRIGMIKNRDDYIESTIGEDSESEIEIKQIDEMLGNVNVLRAEFKKAMEKDKDRYIGISQFVEEKEEEKQRLLKQISGSENSKKRNQIKKYSDEQIKYEYILKYFELIKEDNKKINVKNKIINLQKQFLKCYGIVISKTEQKRDIFILAKKLRYYSNVLIKKDKNILEQLQIVTEYQKIISQLTQKLIENKIIDLGYKSLKLNTQILKYVFKTKIIEMENIVLKIKYLEDNQILVEYYDAKILEYKKKFEIPFEEEIVNRKDRKIKLFKIGG